MAGVTISGPRGPVPAYLATPAGAARGPGFAVASLISNIDAAQPVTLAIGLPPCSICAFFIPIQELPH